MIKIWKRVLDHKNESLFIQIPFHNESYRNGFMSGRYAFIDYRIATFAIKAFLCGYYPFISIHSATKIENQKPLALSFSRNRTDLKYLSLIYRTNHW